jgi:IS5 family transposase
MSIVTYQPEFSPALPTVFGPKEYNEFRRTLEAMDRILTKSGLENDFIVRHLRLNLHHGDKPKPRFCVVRRALRCSILLAITGVSYRELSLRMADSMLFQWFTGMAKIDRICAVSKSTLERYEKMFSNQEIRDLVHKLNLAISDKSVLEELPQKDSQIRFDQIFADTTCVKANIHFPVDWVLLRDAVRTLIKAIELIRAHGLRHRISTPSEFTRKMNKLCIEMTQVRKKPNARKKRKLVLRRMKKLAQLVQGHAENYHRVLTSHWRNTDLSEMEARVIVARIENVLKQLPHAIHQAHERIIGERKVKNQDKILSLYEPDVHVLVRGKSGAEVEFGNALYIAEQSDGFIVDWEFIKGQPPADNKLVSDSIVRITREYGKPKSFTADRGFDSPANKIDLEKLSIINAICPRSVQLLDEKIDDDIFCRLQKRRAMTEARIAIFKNAYLGNPLRSKGFKNRRIRIEWCILAHNLWKISVMAAQKSRPQEEQPEKVA